MQIIQGIREKGAAIVITVIALSLVGFILMDAKSGSNNMANSRSTTIGKVNGSAIDKDEYEKRVQQQQDQQEQQQQGKMAAAQISQLRAQTWDQMVNEKIFYEEAEKLGIDFTSKELAAILSSADQSNPILKEVADPATGKPDEAKVKEAINNIKKAKGEQKEMIDAQLIDPQTLTSISQKYMGLLSAGGYYPTWMAEKDAKEAKSFANISYVAVPYTVINDSTIKVSDDDVAKYVDKHKAQFKQEEGRQISYISFSQLPSQADSAKTKAIVEGLKNDFTAQSESQVRAFVARTGSVIPFDTNFVPKAKLRSGAIDTILKAPVGTVYGPYVDNGSYVLAKILGTKYFPDSVKAKHILIATIDPQTRQTILDDSTAKKRADSINTAINNGASFAALALQYSSDPSKDKGGDLGTFGYGQMVPEFNDFTFTKPVGSRGVVKTIFGYHIVEVESQKGSSPAYKMAYVAKEILASEATINAASNEALKAAAIKDAKQLDEYLQKNGLKKTDVPALIKQSDYQVGQLQDARQMIRWVFDAKKGDVSEPYNINDQFIVAIVNKIYDKGTQDVQTARPMAEVAIREEKKAEEITKKLGATPTLETAAAAYPNLQILTAGADSSITFTARIINGIGQEPKVTGYAFYKDALNKVSAPITGKTGVYIIKVNSIGTKAADTPEVAAASLKQQATAYRSQSVGNWFQALKDQATIKDKRSEANY